MWIVLRHATQST